MWTAKVAFAFAFLMPTLFEAHAGLLAVFPVNQLAAAHQLSSPRDFAALYLESAALLRYWLTAAVWMCGAVAYLADTLLWYQVTSR